MDFDPAPMQFTGLWPVDNKLRWDAVVTKSFRFAVNVATGVISGRVVADSSGRAVPFHGLIVSPGVDLERALTTPGEGFVPRADGSAPFEVSR